MNAFFLNNYNIMALIKTTLVFTSLLLSSISQAARIYQAPPDSLDKVNEPSIKSSIETFAEASECWTPEQKQEFANVFFIERGKFTVPKEPIVLKSFEKP